MRKPERNVLPLTDVSDFTAPVGIPGARIYFVAPFLAARDTPADAVELSLKVGHKTFKHPEIICISQNARDSPQMVKSIEVPFLLYGRPEPDIRISRAPVWRKMSGDAFCSLRLNLVDYVWRLTYNVPGFGSPGIGFFEEEVAVPAYETGDVLAR
jgi:hypothetical protein